MDIVWVILVFIFAMVGGPKICNFFGLGLCSLMVFVFIMQVCLALLFYLITGTEPGSL